MLWWCWPYIQKFWALSKGQPEGLTYLKFGGAKIGSSQSGAQLRVIKSIFMTDIWMWKLMVSIVGWILSVSEGWHRTDWAPHMSLKTLISQKMLFALVMVMGYRLLSNDLHALHCLQDLSQLFTPVLARLWAGRKREWNVAKDSYNSKPNSGKALHLSQDQSILLPLFPFLNGGIPRVKLQIETTQNLSFLYSTSLINSIELCYERIAKELRAKG